MDDPIVKFSQNYEVDLQKVGDFYKVEQQKKQSILSALTKIFSSNTYPKTLVEAQSLEALIFHYEKSETKFNAGFPTNIPHDKNYNLIIAYILDNKIVWSVESLSVLFYHAILEEIKKQGSFKKFVETAFHDFTVHESIVPKFHFDIALEQITKDFPSMKVFTNNLELKYKDLKIEKTDITQRPQVQPTQQGKKKVTVKPAAFRIDLAINNRIVTFEFLSLKDETKKYQNIYNHGKVQYVNWRNYAKGKREYTLQNFFKFDNEQKDDWVNYISNLNVSKEEKNLIYQSFRNVYFSLRKEVIFT